MQRPQNPQVFNRTVVFKVIITCYILSLATQGFGSTIFGYFVYTDISTLFIYFVFLFQIATGTLRLNKILIILFIYIFFQTFVFNYNTISEASELKNFSSPEKQYIGLILFSTSFFSFISFYQNRLSSIIKIYYKFVFVIACFVLLQTVINILYGNSIFLKQIIFGKMFELGIIIQSPEVFDILPRAIGLSSEPAHYALLSLPGVYIALLVMLGQGRDFNLYNKYIAGIILLGFVLSFSTVGYFGLFLCMISIFGNDFKKNILIKVSFVMCFIAILFILAQTVLITKFTSLIEMLKDIEGFEYNTNYQTGFALVSNLVVAKDGLVSSHYLGTGLNTHQNTYGNVLYNHFAVSQVVNELNRENAGSLFIRIPSEFGIPGIVAFILYLIHYKSGKKIKSCPNKTINSLSLIILITYCSRNGHYLNNIFWLFSALYYYSYILLQKGLVSNDS